MNVAEVKNLPVAEKLHLMELLWDDLREHYEAVETSDELRARLEDRRARVQRGDTRLLDWDSVKGTIGRG